MRRLPRWTCACALALLAQGGIDLVAGPPPDEAPQAPAAPTPTAAPAMRHHFDETMRVHDAVIRGDLPVARQVAVELQGRDFAGLPEKASPHVSVMKDAARKLAASTDVLAASAAAAVMLGTCGDCHRAVGAMPAVSVRPLKPVGETVGHMLTHQHAAELLVQGLVVPSSATWNEGAQALRTAPLKPGKLPRDPKLTPEIVAGEARLHELADEAAGTSTTVARAGVYGQMLATCAQCHTLHANIWGPSRR